MGSRWGPEGPPPEAYSRVTNPERFAPLHDIAAESLDRLQSRYRVFREDRFGLDPKLEPGQPARATVRLVPEEPEGGPLTIGFTSFPGLMMRLGRWFVEPIPVCGCDACDETLDEGRRRMESFIDDLVSGRVRESVERPAIGPSWLVTDIGGSRERSRVTRAQAKAMIASAGGRRSFDYAPWPGRAVPSRVG
jgi:hypothetical protein